MSKLFSDIRFYVLMASTLSAILIFTGIRFFYPGELTQITRLDQWYGLTAVVFLYLSYVVNSVVNIWPKVPYKRLLNRSIRALVIGSLELAAIHGLISFFGELKGFEGLKYLNNRYLLAIFISSLAFIGLSISLLAKNLKILNWQMFQRLGYVAGLLIVIHVLLLGSHFVDLSTLIPRIFLVALLVLLGLEAWRLDQRLKYKFNWSFAVYLIVASIILTLDFTQSSLLTNSPLNVHSLHLQIAQQLQQGPSVSLISNNPGLIGDRTKRFTVSFSSPETVTANTPTTLNFQVFSASNGNQVTLFNQLYDKYFHLVIVDSQLQYFNHIHPELDDKGFHITTTFPSDGVYHLYLDFQPVGAIEQQFAFTLRVGDSDQKLTFSSATPDQVLTKVVDQYSITLTKPDNLKASLLNNGQQSLTFTVKDLSGNPITTLDPYLSAYGHLVMINQSTFDYTHVHPINVLKPGTTTPGGPNVEFLPMGLYEPIKPGIYRVFAQFNPDNHLLMVDYTIQVN